MRTPGRTTSRSSPQKPPKPCFTAAKKHQILSYYRIQTLDEMRICLAAGYPFVFGFTVYEAFESPQSRRPAR